MIEIQPIKLFNWFSDPLLHNATYRSLIFSDTAEFHRFKPSDAVVPAKKKKSAGKKRLKELAVLSSDDNIYYVRYKSK